MAPKKLFYALVAISLATTAFAADHKSPKIGNKSKVTWVPLVFPDQPVKLPARYNANDAKMFYVNYIAKLKNLEKKEFETTADHDKRIADLDAQLLPFNKTDSYVFSPGVWPRDYDADSQTYSVGNSFYGYTCQIAKNRDKKPLGWLSCVMGRVADQSERYEASNAYGATTMVTKSRTEQLALAIPGDCEVARTLLALGNNNERYISDLLVVPIAKAKQIKEKNQTISTLFIGKIAEHKIITKARARSATYSSPYDMHIQEHNIPFNLEKVVYYVWQTGEILSQKDYSCPTPSNVDWSNS